MTGAGKVSAVLGTPADHILLHVIKQVIYVFLIICDISKNSKIIKILYTFHFLVFINCYQHFNIFPFFRLDWIRLDRLD